MKIHHLNCGSLCPCGGKLPKSIFPSELVCHCLMIESEQGLILIDSGLGKKDIENPKRLGLISSILGIKKDLKLSAIDQIKNLGFSKNDVRHIIPTHLDLDHAGGINDFPNAIVHTSKSEYSSALFPKSINEKTRYRQSNWNENTKWQIYDDKAKSYGEKWFGFNSVREVEGLPSDILLIPLPGHSKGHFGIAIQNNEGWLLHAGDSYFNTNEISLNRKPLLGLSIFQRLIHQSYKNAINNQQQLIRLKNSESKVKIICSHDLEKYKNSIKNSLIA